MPPKQKPKKEEDLPDISNFPKVNSYFIRYFFHTDSLEYLNSLSSHLYDYPLQNFKIIKREAILELGRNKQIIDENLEIIPPELLAKSAACLFYEQIALAMRDKDQAFKEFKSKFIAEYLEKNQELSKNEEKKEIKISKSAKSKPGKEENPQINIPIQYPENETDLIFVLVDYPLTVEEYLELNKESYCLNSYVNIYISKTKKEEEPQLNENDEISKAEKEGVKEKTEEKEDKEEKVELTEEEKQKIEEDNAALKQYIENSKQEEQNCYIAFEKAHRGSPLNDFSSLKIECDYDVEDFETSFSNFDEKLNKFLISQGNKLIEYHIFISKLNRVLLYPQTANQLKEIQVAKKDIKEEKVEKIEKKIEAPAASGKGSKAAKHEKKDEDQPAKPKYDTESIQRFKKLEIVPSGDEDLQYFSFQHYYKNLLNINQEFRKAGVILASILEEIIEEKLKVEDGNKLKEIISEFKESIQPSKTENILVPNSLVKILKEENILETNYNSDTLFNTGINISQFEQQLQSNLLLSGINRGNMPNAPELSESIRGSKKTEIIPFSSIPFYLYNVALIITKFESLFEKVYPQQKFQFGNKNNQIILDKNTIVQRLSEEILFDQEIVTQYFANDDCLLVGFHYKNPPGRIYRQQWFAPYISIPFFDNWVKNFKDLNTKVIFDIDDRLVGPISEKVKLMYPSDNSVIRVTKKIIGNSLKPHITVFKDNLIFGLHSKGDFWLHFNDEYRLEVEMENLISNQGKEYKGAKATITSLCGLLLQFNSEGDVIQIREDLKTIQENTPKPYLSMQLFEKSEQPPTESYRVITGKGSVIRYLSNGVIEILYSNGNYAEYKGGQWITVNCLGKRRGKNPIENLEFDMDPISCTSITDPETGCKSMIRSDNCISVLYIDGTQYTKHKDGTTMITSSNSNEIIVESKGFAPVKITYDRLRANSNNTMGKGSTDALVGSDSLMSRSNDGRLIQTYLPDGSIVSGFKERQETDSSLVFNLNYINVLHKHDGTVVKIKQDGEVVIVSSNLRRYLNKIGQNKPSGCDVDYMFELFGVPQERRSGVYTANINESKLWTIDSEGNNFVIFSNGETKERMAVSFNLMPSEEYEKNRPPSPRFEGEDYIEEQNLFLPPPREIHPPSTFIIKNDNTGIELVSDDQLEHYMKTKEKDKEAQITKGENLLGMEKSFSTSIITKKIKEQIVLDNMKISKNYVLPKTVETVRKSIPSSSKVEEKVFTFKKIITHPKIEGNIRDSFNDTLKRFNDWKERSLKKESEYKINDSRKEEEKKAEKEVQALIAKKRNPKENEELKNDNSEEGENIAKHLNNENPEESKLDYNNEEDNDDELDVPENNRG